MPIAVFYLVALGLPVLVTVVATAMARSAWPTQRPAAGKPRLLLGLWIVASLLAIGVGGLASLAIAIARATTPERAEPERALGIVLPFLALQGAMSLALRRALRRRAADANLSQ